MTENVKIQEIIEIISCDQEYKVYFFNRLIEAVAQSKLNYSEEWFNALYNAKLLTPDNISAIAYVRILISNGMSSNCNFINLVNNWLDSSLQSELPVCDIMWFLEEVVKLNDESIINKCKKIIINNLNNQKTINGTINSMVYNKQINGFIFTDKILITDILSIIINLDNFSCVSQDIHTILTLREQISKFLIGHEKTDYLSTVLDQLFLYIQTKPSEFLMVDTIDGGYYKFSYGDYLVGFLIDIIAASSDIENENLIDLLVQKISSPKIEQFEKIVIFKIIIYLVNKIKRYELIMSIVSLINSLEELSSIRYAIYHCVIKQCIDTWFDIFPNFDDWLSKLDYSEQHQNHYEDKEILVNLAKQTKLSLLYPFRTKSSLYNDLKIGYPYEVQEPIKSFEIKSSWESKNNYIDAFKNASIEDIIEYLNGEKKIVTDFPDMHLEEAFRQDFKFNNDKYVNDLNYFFNSLSLIRHKSCVLYELSNDIRENGSSSYEIILEEILRTEDINEQYFYSILSLLCEAVDKYAMRILPHEAQIFNFLSKNITVNSDTDNIDDLGAGLNSLSGKCLYVLIKLSLAKDKTLSDFANNINDYSLFLSNPNGLLIIGQYLFWLYKSDSFLRFFKALDIRLQNIALLTYFEYSRYAQKEIFNLAIQNNLINEEKNLHSYINHAMYFYLIDENNYLFDLLNSQISNEKIIEAIVSSINTYNDQFIKLNATHKLFEIWKIMLTSPIFNKVASRVLYSSKLIDIQNKEELDLFYKTISLLTLHSIIYENEAVKLLTRLTVSEKFNVLIDILISLANNSPRTYYMNIEYLDNILFTLNNQNFKLLDNNREKLTLLIARLKEINYPLTIKIKN